MIMGGGREERMIRHTFAGLVEALKSGAEQFFDDRGWFFSGRVLGIEAEDGSGECWNVKVVDLLTKEYRTIFVRTSD